MAAVVFTAVADTNTPQDARRAIRERANWYLRYVVIDELHYYRGV